MNTKNCNVTTCQYHMLGSGCALENCLYAETEHPIETETLDRNCIICGEAFQCDATSTTNICPSCCTKIYNLLNITI